MNGAIKTFPWASLTKLTRKDLEFRRAVLLKVGVGFEGRKLAEALSARTTEPVALSWGAWRFGSGLRAPGSRVSLVLPSLGLQLSVTPEADLARLLIARLLGQKYEMGWPAVQADAALQGAVAALILDLARQCTVSEAPQLSVNGVADPSSVAASQRLMLSITVRLGERKYGVDLEASLLSEQSGGTAIAAAALPRATPSSLGALGAVAVRVPWLVAVAWTPANVLHSLLVGDVWLPGAGWFSERRGFADELTRLSADPIAGCLAAPGASWGWPVSGVPGKFTLGSAARLVPVSSGEQVESAMTEKRPQLDEILGEAPVMVRVELGAVEMTAAQWAQLRPGDIVETAHKVGCAVQLRAGAQLFAEGQLVDVDGQIGVQIVSVAGPSKSQS